MKITGIVSIIFLANGNYEQRVWGCGVVDSWDFAVKIGVQGIRIVRVNEYFKRVIFAIKGIKVSFIYKFRYSNNLNIITIC